MSAAFVGLAATMALLVALGASGRWRVAALALLGGWVLAAAALVDRGHTAWWLPVIPAALSAAAAVGSRRLRGVLRAVPMSAVLGAQCLSILGLARVAGQRVGWLPETFTAAAVASDLAWCAACLLGAVWAARSPARVERIAKLIAAVGVARVAATVAMQWAWVRPLPGFEGLWRLAVAPMFFVAALPAWVRGPAARGQR